MRTIRWLPLAYFAGSHGFALFAPYAALIMGVYCITQWRKRQLAV
jgi:hypothetical protein